MGDCSIWWLSEMKLKLIEWFKARGNKNKKGIQNERPYGVSHLNLLRYAYKNPPSLDIEPTSKTYNRIPHGNAFTTTYKHLKHS